MDIKVLFFRNGTSCFYNFNGKTCEANVITMNKLKENLSIPFKVQFSGLSRAQIQKVIGYFLDNTIDVEIRMINVKKSNLLNMEAVFVKKKNYVEVYKVPNASSLYSRSKNCNPFLYTIINSKKVLFEVSKDDVKDNIDNCYFLSCELDSSEKEFFDSLYDKLECDYVYKMEKNLNDRKILKKKL